MKNGKTSVRYSSFNIKSNMSVGQPLPEIETQDSYGRAVLTSYQWYEGSVASGNERKPGDIIKEDTTYCLTVNAKPTEKYYYEDDAYIMVSHIDATEIVVGENGSSISGVVTYKPDNIVKDAAVTVTLPKIENGMTYGEYRKNVQFEVLGKLLSYTLSITEYKGDDDTGEIVAGTDAYYLYDCETKEWTEAFEDGPTVAQMDSLTFKEGKTYVVGAYVTADISDAWIIPAENFHVTDNENAERIEPVDLIAPLAMGAEAFYYVEQPKDCGGDKSRCPSAPYTDAPKYGNWAHAGIDFCISKGLMNGTSADKFNPKGSMTRAMVVTVLWRQAGSPAPSKPAAFGDLTANWYKDAVAWAAEQGVVTGKSETKFAPNDPVTREQMAAILQRYTANVLKKDTSKTTDITSFPDYSSVSNYAKAALAWANAEGLITGSASNGKTYLFPRNGATREQVATILMRFVQNIA